MNEELNYNTKDLNTMEIIDTYKSILHSDKRFPKNFWKTEDKLDKAAIVIRYLIDDELHISTNDIPKRINIKLLNNHKLRGLINTCFKGSIYELINNAYPNRFKPWEFPVIAEYYWNSRTVIEASKWLFEEKLGWTLQDIKQNISYSVFKQFNLDEMLECYCQNSIHSLLDLVYPGKFNNTLIYNKQLREDCRD